jgi:hypothetical protein
MADIDEGTLKQEIRSLLVSAKGGLTVKELMTDYQAFNNNSELPYKQLCYEKLIDLLQAWPDVCYIQPHGNHSSMKILAKADESTKHILSMVNEQRNSKGRSRGRSVAFSQTRAGRSRRGATVVFHQDNSHDHRHDSSSQIKSHRNHRGFNQVRLDSFNARANCKSKFSPRSAISSDSYSNKSEQGLKDQSQVSIHII